MNPVTPFKPQFLTQYETDSDYIIRKILRMHSNYIIQTIPKYGFWRYKQCLDGL